ncbi:MAG: hypothetical protein ACR2QO_16610 [Acidimicrobiales bacterium]
MKVERRAPSVVGWPTVVFGVLMAGGVAACGAGAALAVTTDAEPDSEYQFRVYSSLERVSYDEDEDPREFFVEGVLREVRIEATDPARIGDQCDIRGVDSDGLDALRNGDQVAIPAEDLFSNANGSVTLWRGVVAGCEAVTVEVILD